MRVVGMDDIKEKAHRNRWAFSYRASAIPTFPRDRSLSIIGAEGLNFRVRNGNGCFPFAKLTGAHCLTT